MQLPNDPILLLSVVNTKLRDYYPSLAHLCDDMMTEESGITTALAAIHYYYDPETNQFQPAP